MSEATVVAAATPIVEGAIKALAPEAEQLLKSAEAHLVAEGEHLKAEIDASHNTVLTWLRSALSGASTAPAASVDPTSAVPAPQQ